MRIVSLLPACTEWVAAFGGLDDLVGRSHLCDYPAEVASLPVVTGPSKRAAGSASARGGTDGDSMRDAISPFAVDAEQLRDLRPDVLLTQTQCDVCAVTEEQLLAEAADVLGPSTEIVSLRGSTFQDVLKDALRIGRSVGRLADAMTVLGEGEVRIQQLRDRLGLGRRTPAHDLPSVAALEWCSPFMTAGHWTPDLIEMAGGRPTCASPGGASEKLDPEVLLEADPDIIALIPCGMDVEAGRAEASLCRKSGAWDHLQAVRRRRVYLFDGRAYFNRPGPRLYRSVELLASAIYGERAGIEVGQGEMERL